VDSHIALANRCLFLFRLRHAQLSGTSNAPLKVERLPLKSMDSLVPMPTINQRPCSPLTHGAVAFLLEKCNTLPGCPQ
jgi:hypothetical protein